MARYGEWAGKYETDYEISPRHDDRVTAVDVRKSDRGDWIVIARWLSGAGEVVGHGTESEAGELAAKCRERAGV